MIRAVHFSQVVCDTCGAEWSEMHDTATLARIAAALRGWKFTEYKRRVKGQKGPRAWDACPDCVLPATAEDAQRMIDQREETR